jgi:hypothetical protein
VRGGVNTPDNGVTLRKDGATPMTETQFYTPVAIPSVGILMNGALFIYLGGRMDKLVEKVSELDSRVAVLEDRAR